MPSIPGLLEPPSQRELYSLGGFLAQRPCGRPALGLEEAHGFLTALHCIPGTLAPGDWLPVVFGGDVERAHGRTGAAMASLVMRLSNDLARALFDTARQEHYAPLFAFPGTGQQASARSWCDGFLVGLDVKSLSWIEQLEEDAGMRRVLCPIIALSTRFAGAMASQGRALTDDADEEELEDMLPSAVLAAYGWWRLGGVAEALASSAVATSAALA